MKRLSWMVVSGALMVAGCSGSDESPDAAAVPTEQEASSGAQPVEDGVVASTAPLPEESDRQERCPDEQLLASATGLQLIGSESVVVESDSLGFDPTEGATLCTYGFDEQSTLIVTLHGSPVNTSIFLDAPAGDAEVAELSTGVVRVAYTGVNSCEVYGDRTSAVVFASADTVDACVIASAALEAVQ